MPEREYLVTTKQNVIMYRHFKVTAADMEGAREAVEESQWHGLAMEPHYEPQGPYEVTQVERLNGEDDG